MFTADDKKFNPPDGTAYHISPVTVYFDLEPKQLKIKYEMDRFLFSRRENFKDGITAGNLSLLVRQYKEAVFDATGAKAGTSPDIAAKKKANRLNTIA